MEKTRRRAVRRNEKSTTSGWAINFLGHFLHLGETKVDTNRHIKGKTRKEKVLLSSIPTGNHIQYIHARALLILAPQCVPDNLWIAVLHFRRIGKPCNHV